MRAALPIGAAIVLEPSFPIWRSVVDEIEPNFCPFEAIEAAARAGLTGSGTSDETEELALPDELDFS
jgi:hypothetical protein